ncbi:MAG: hypothetical protein AB7N80_02035 [Bdellovibrionales bacterium]
MKLVWVSFLLTMSSIQVSAKILSIAVGQVRNHVVTSREVQINQALEQLLYPEKKDKPIKILSDTDSPAFSKQVTAVLLEWVIFMEAANMEVSKASSEELSLAAGRVKKTLSKMPAWKNLRVSSKEMQEALQRKLQAKKFIRFRADSSVIPVSDVEAQRYFEQNRVKFGNLPFGHFRSNIKGLLARQQVERRLKDWFEILQSKYQVRNFLAEI